MNRPSAQTALLLPLYDLINTNSNFVNTIINTCTKIDAETKKESTQSSGDKITLLTSLLSFASYLFQNNRSDRTNIYSRLLLIILLRLMEENSVLNYIAREGSTASIRLCRQVQETVFAGTKKRMLILKNEKFEIAFSCITINKEQQIIILCSVG